jgi:DivIVA domain-containing protein
MMNETERRQRVISSTPQLTPDEVATRSFGTKVRGFAEAEVRGFLKRVAEQLSVARDRERELEAAVDALEEQLRQPRPLSEQELLDALGEETARLLRSAREASDDIRAKADERAKRVVDDAQAAADQTRAAAEEVLTSRTQQAEARAAEIIADAEAVAANARETATNEAQAIVESARREGREMLEEAKAARVRVLADLIRRRTLLRAQIEQLRSGRDHLLDAYRTVKRTFLEATEALAQVEVTAATERSTVSEPVVDVAAEIAAEIEALDAAADRVAEDGVIELVDDVEVVNVVAVEQSEADSSKLADVDSLFARLRAGHDEGPGAGGQPAEATTEAKGGGAALAVETRPAEAPAPAASDIPKVSATDWRAKRAHTVDPLAHALLKRAKRTAQDEQNALLDAVRRHKGRPSAEQVLPATDATLETWSAVLLEAIDSAYGAGRVAAGGNEADATDDLVREAAAAVVGPLRERLIAAIDFNEQGDTGGLVERIGARYREWKNQTLERTLGEVVAFAWARGVYAAVPDGAVLWWVPFEEGRCSDCDDNALEPTVKGKDFPTGQPFPPAHPGCKCLLAPVEMLTAPTSK